MQKLWAHSGDSHYLEPDDLWGDLLPPAMAARMPRSERVSDSEEVVHVDGQQIRRKIPSGQSKKGASGQTIFELNYARPLGARDMQVRLEDLNNEGIWAEAMYASLGLWENMIRDNELARAAAAAQNEWRASEIMAVAPDRFIPGATVALLDVNDSVSGVEQAVDLGFHMVSLPTGVPEGQHDWNADYWEPLWAALEGAGMVVGFHIGSDTGQLVVHRGNGGAVLNYFETTFSGQRAAAKMVASGALDRHSELKVLVSEGGATWVPFAGDRMNEAYRQHGMFVRPELSRLPKDIMYSQVYASFQHDETGPASMSAMGYRNAMFGSDYPHVEGTFGHTQEALHELFDDVSPEVSERIRFGAFKELFPHVSDPPTSD